MSDASERYAQQIEAARLAVSRGDRPAAVEALSAAIETTRSNPGLHREHAAALVRLAALEQELGRPAEAERHLMEAIAVGERHAGSDHPSLGAALNELSRLHIRRADYSRAEPVLKRLLLIARAKGDRHPDVATALAGIAAAKRGLGHHAAAELLYRNALQIREESLAPDHMAIVVTLEQLAETCAARGNLAEALIHLQRALLRRERALGVEHATVHGLRARIAELQHRAVESAASEAEPRDEPPAPATEVARPAEVIRAAEVVRAPVAPPSLAETTSSPLARATAEWRVKQAEARSAASPSTSGRRSGELAFLYVPEPDVPSTAHRPQELLATPPHSVVAESAAPTRGISDVHAVSESSPARAADDATVIPATWNDVPVRGPSRRRARHYATAGAALALLAIAGFAFSSHDADDGEHAPALAGAEAHAALVTQASMSGAPSTVDAPPAATGAESDSPLATPSDSNAGALPAAAPPAPASDLPSAAPSAPAALAKLRRLAVPNVTMPSLDSVVLASANVARGTGTDPVSATGMLRTSASEEERSVTPPVLVGSAPTPRFPDELRAQRVEGEVVVRFRVTEKGRVDASSMQVVQSPHEMLTAAVRSVLPRFRFEPARSGAPESKPQAAWVQFRTQFTARN